VQKAFKTGNAHAMAAHYITSDTKYTHRQSIPCWGGGYQPMRGLGGGAAVGWMGQDCFNFGQGWLMGLHPQVTGHQHDHL